MPVIYEPKGKALEYSPLACNLYKGCSHACTYCYAPSATFTKPDIFSSDSYIKPRPNIITQIQKDAEKLKGDPRQILLCFTSDPYQPIEKNLMLTRQTLRIFADNHLNTTILTKSGGLAKRDFDILSRNPENHYAATLTTDDPEESLKWEPGAALPKDRIETLKAAKLAGISTWVSFEPVFNPEAVYRMIEETHTFIDLYKIGKMNYHPLSKTIDWHIFLLRSEALLDKYGKERYIKKDLEKFR